MVRWHSSRSPAPLLPALGLAGIGHHAIDAEPEPGPEAGPRGIVLREEVAFDGPGEEILGEVLR